MESRLHKILRKINVRRRRIWWGLNDLVISVFRKTVLLPPFDPIESAKLRVALVCIAKDEDRYIDEWIQYYLKIGVDDIFIYQNNWRYLGQIKSEHVHWLELDGLGQQLPAYNDFISTESRRYDFGIFFDVDEYLCLVKDPDVKTFLSRFREQKAIGINWRLFGDNGHKKVESGNYSLVKRFTRCGKKLNKHIKTIVNFRATDGGAKFGSPHFLQNAWRNKFTVAVDGKSYIQGPFLYRHDYKLAWINHYCSKTYEEFITNKRLRGCADMPWPVGDRRTVRPDWWFTKNNQNDIENLIVYDKLYGDV